MGDPKWGEQLLQTQGSRGPGAWSRLAMCPLPSPSPLPRGCHTRQWDPFCQPRTPAHTGETRGRAAAALLGGTSAWPTRVGPAADSPRFCAPRPGEGGAVTVGASRPGDAPERLRPARSSPRSDPSGPIGTDSGLEVRLASPRAAPRSLLNDGYGPHSPPSPRKQAATFPRGWERRMLSKTLPFGASNVYAGERTRGWLAPSRQSRADMSTRGRGPEPSITG